MTTSYLTGSLSALALNESKNLRAHSILDSSPSRNGTVEREPLVSESELFDTNARMYSYLTAQSLDRGHLRAYAHLGSHTRKERFTPMDSSGSSALAGVLIVGLGIAAICGLDQLGYRQEQGILHRRILLARVFYSASSGS